MYGGSRLHLYALVSSLWRLRRSAPVERDPYREDQHHQEVNKTREIRDGLSCNRLKELHDQPAEYKK